ncbi:MAG: flippase-like domain-containing protein [Bradymonadaceae bacterium]|nr:flippase-like domain-containing protein [Lujinxingiaceae bacterium]
MNKLERRILWGVILGVIIYAAIGLLTDARSLAAELLDFPLRTFAGALGLTLVNYALRFLKWHYYLRRLGHRVEWLHSLNVFLAGLVMSVTPGKVGEVLKSLLLRDSRGIPAAQTAPIVIAERLTDLLGLFVIAGVGIISFDFGRPVFVASLIVVAASILFLQQPRLVTGLLDLWQRFPVVGSMRPKLDEAYASMRRLLTLPVLAWTTLLSVLAWSMEALAFYWILVTLGASETTLYLAFFIYAITTILGAVSFLPGGLGVTEGSMIGVLLLSGVFAAQSTAAAATYLIRFATLWFGVLVGFVALIVFRSTHVQSVNSPEPEVE